MLLVGSCLLVIFYALASLIYYSLDGIYFNPPVALESSQVFTTKQTYKSGEVIEITYSFCKYRDITGVFQWQSISDDTNREGFFSPTESSLPVGCYKDLTIPIGVGSTIPGTYHFTGTISYKINDLNTVIIPLSTNKFIVK